MNDTERRWAVLILRWFLGLTFLTTACFKFFVMGLGGWVGYLQSGFEATPMPGWLVTLFGYLLPFGEVTIGLLLVFGLWRRFGFTLAGLVSVALSCGKFFQANAAAAAGQGDVATAAFATAANNGIYVLAAVVGLLLVTEPLFALDSFFQGS